MKSVTVNGLKKGDRVRIAGPVEATVLKVRKLGKNTKEANLSPQAKRDGVDVYTVDVSLASPNSVGDVFLLLEDDDQVSYPVAGS